MKGKITAVLFIVVFILVVAVVCTFLTSWDKAGNDEAQGEDDGGSSVVVVMPTPGTTSPAETPAASAAISTPAPTASPAGSPAPTPTPTPAPTPTPEPVYTEQDLGSGSFKSDTGAKLNIRADWSARTISSSQIEVKVKISLDSYSIHLQAVPNSVNVNLAGQYTSLDAPAVDYDGAEAINTVLAEKTFTVDLAQGESDSLTLAVEWHFGGTYGDVELPVIECGGSINLSR